MLTFLEKIIFWLKKPKIIIVVETEQKEEKTFETVYRVLNQYFLKGKESLTKRVGFSVFFKNKILILNSKIEEVEKLRFLIKQSSLPILIIADFKKKSLNSVRFISQLSLGGKEEKNILSKKINKTEKQNIKIEELISPHGHLILNFDNRINKKLKEKIRLNCLSFGFQVGADIQATDFKIDNNKITFKINYQGNIVPIWLEHFEKKQIYSILASIGVALILNFNLIEISQNFKYRQ